MGIFRRSAPAPDIEDILRAAAELVKAAAAPPTLPPVGPALPQPIVPLERTDFGQLLAPFAPGVPFTPVGIDPREPATGRPAPRRSEFAASVNLQVANAGRLIPFSVLRDVADKVDVMRRCIEVRKSQMAALSWDITLSPVALKKIMADEHLNTPGAAAQEARRRFEPEMARLRTFWEKPDPLNQMDWVTWLNVLMEEHLVVDALSIWPRRRANGNTVGFEIIDGATIKPLLDHRGSTPLPPNPAYQQILHGFPRGEFTATSTPDASGFLGDQLIYRPRFRRTWTPYGYPDTEHALSAADIYLKRMTWLRAEFDEGTTPDTWLKLPVESKIGPGQLRAYEVALNAELAGQTAERLRLRMLPPGASPEQMNKFGDLYKPELDEFLVKLLCSCYSVMPTEIGFPPGSGIGGKGHQEGEANSSQRKAIRPTAQWIEGVCTEISRRFLGMPDELCFKLIGYETEDQNMAEEVADSQTRRGAVTLNDDRAARGLPLYAFPEADTPFIVTGSGLVFLDGAMAAQAAAAGTDPAVPEIDPALDPATEAPVVVDAPPASATDPRPPTGPDETPEEGDPIGADDPVPDGFIRVNGYLRRRRQPASAISEAQKFLTFARRRRSSSWRDFEFEHLDAAIAADFNAAGAAGDLDSIKAMVVDLGKAKARGIPRAARAKLIETQADALRTAVLDLLPAAGDLTAAWDEHTATTKSASDAADWVGSQLAAGTSTLDAAVAGMVTAGHRLGWEHGWLEGDPDDPDDVPAGDRSRLGALLEDVPELREALIAAGITAVAGALVSRDRDTAITDVFDTGSWAGTFATVELTASISAGTLDSAVRQKLAVVELVAGGDECDFCQGYDGRILGLDEDAGMPPLHRGCQCTVDPLP